MTIIEIKKGDLLDATEKIIAHQCNCVTVRSHGLSAAIAKKWPWADMYSKRCPISRKNCASIPDIPGTTKIMTDPNDEHGQQIACLFGQWTPGKPNAFSRYYPKTYPDDRAARLTYFSRSLTSLEHYCEKNNIEKIAMPFKIGCGLAGGNWNDYEQMLENSTLSIILYLLE